MTYPEILLLPVLMVADYYLTLLGSILREEKYADYIVVENYELNPLFRKSVRERKLINYKHLLGTALVFGGVYFFAEVSITPDIYISFILGMLLIYYSVLVGRHITNILIFKYFIKNSDQVHGKIEYTYEAAIFMAMYSNFIPLIAMIIICIYERSFFALGSVCGVGLLALVHLRFLRKMRRRMLRKQETTQTNLEAAKTN